MTRSLLAGLLLGGAAFHPALAAFPTVRLEMVVEKQIQSPTTITNAHDGSGRLFVCDQRGKIWIIKNGMLLPTPFMDVSSKLVVERTAFDERGLLGLTFHPQFGQVGMPGYRKFYIFYSATSPNAPGTTNAPVDCRSTLAEFQVSAGNPDVADVASERILLSFDKPQFNHNGGQVEFGPDGMLYFGTGDGGSSNDNNAGHTGGSTSRPKTALGNAQDMTSWMGKIHRINPLGTNGPGGQYGIPADNPFVGQAGVRAEIWCYGMRNPWRFMFDRANGRMFCADVGQGAVEEVDIITKGGNFGWRNLEGTIPFPEAVGAPALTGTVVMPIAQYAHPGQVVGTPALPQYGVSITGGILYRGSAIPELQGKYIFGDYSEDGINPKGVLLGLEESAGSWAMSKLTVVGGNPIPYFIQAFGEDEAGEIYVGAKFTRPPSLQSAGFPAGAILRLGSGPLPPVTAHKKPAKNNTIYSESTNSNALGQRIFTGKIKDGDLRRALLQYNFADIPAGATITAAQLNLTITNSNTSVNPITTVTAHRLSRDWGAATSVGIGAEGAGGPSTPGDATWSSSKIQVGPNWTTPGGDFSATASSSGAAGGSGLLTFPNLAADVNDFIANPAGNFGWLLKGDESGSITARGYGSKESVNSWPDLAVTYIPLVKPLTPRDTWERQYFLIGQYLDPKGDEDKDGVGNLLEYAWNRNPKDAAHPNKLADNFEFYNNDGILNVQFHRNPNATDLTYSLEIGTDLTGWQTMVSSVGGGLATGVINASESPVFDQAPLIRVSVNVGGDPGNFFVRLKVTRP